MQGAYDLENHTNEEASVNSNNDTNNRQSKPQSRTNNNRNTNAYTQAPSGPTARMNHSVPRQNTSNQGAMEISDEEEYPFSKAN